MDVLADQKQRAKNGTNGATSNGATRADMRRAPYLEHDPETQLFGDAVGGVDDGRLGLVLEGALRTIADELEILSAAMHSTICEVDGPTAAAAIYRISRRARAMSTFAQRRVQAAVAARNASEVQS